MIKMTKKDNGSSIFEDDGLLTPAPSVRGTHSLQLLPIVGSKTFCATIAFGALAISTIWPAEAVLTSSIAVLVFYILFLNYRIQRPTNLAFFFVCVTFIILLSYSALWTILLNFANLNSVQVTDPRSDGVQYIAMAVDALILGACFATTNRCQPRNGPHKPIQSEWIYITAAFVPLILNVVLYYASLRGLDYVEIHKAGIGPEKYILFIGVVTHGSFIRIFGGWPSLGKRARLMTIFAVLLFVYVYAFLLPLRTNLFEFGMYAFYFFGRQAAWYTKLAVVVAVLVVFSWIAIYRADDSENLHDMNLAVGTLSAMSFGTLMVEMVPWAQNVVRTEGRAWGQTFLLELEHSELAPNVRYVRDRAPEASDTGRGLGFFYVAELVLNFGSWGGLFAICLLGMLLQAMSLATGSLMRHTVLPAFLAASFPLIRNDIMTDLKIPIYMIVSCLILDRAGRLVRYTKKLMTLSRIAQATK